MFCIIMKHIIIMWVHMHYTTYCRYQSVKDASQVDYMRFSDEIESIFTQKDLEKTPTANVVQFVPPVDVNMYVLSPEEEQTLQKTMHRLAERVRPMYFIIVIGSIPGSA